MYKEKTVAVIVPAYNEENQIEKVIKSIPIFVDYLVIIDDASTDRTQTIIEQNMKLNKRIILISHEHNQGVGGAIASGYKWARDSNIDAAVVMAGDGQMDPDEMPDLLNCVVSGEVDYSKANRLIYARAFELMPKIRFFGNAALSFLTKIASGYWHISDSQTGYTAISLKALKIIDWDKMYKKYGQPNDLLVSLNVHSFKVRDIPMKPVYNVGEVSKLKIGNVTFSIGFLLIRKFFWRLKEKYIFRDFHPLIFFYCYGFVSILAFIVLFIRLVKLWSKFGYIPEITLMMLLFIMGTGLQAFFFAMWMDQEYNKNLR